MARHTKNPVTLMAALDMTLLFAGALEQNPFLSMNEFRELHASSISNETLLAYFELVKRELGIDVVAFAQQKVGHNRVTEDGRRLLRHIRRHLDRIKAGPRGTAKMTVASFAFSTAYVLAPAVGHYYRTRIEDHEKVRLTFREYPDADPYGVVRWVAEWKVACAFVAFSTRFDLSVNRNEVEFRAVQAGIKPVLAYSRWPEGKERKKPIDPKSDEFAELPYVVPQHTPTEWMKHLPPDHLAPKGGWIRARSYVEVLALLRNGVGRAVLPGVFDGCLEQTDIADDVGYLELDDATPLPFGVLVPRLFDAKASSAAKEFVELVTTHLSKPRVFSPRHNKRGG